MLAVILNGCLFINKFTWLKAHQAEDEKYMEIKEEIRQEIESLRKSVSISYSESVWVWSSVVIYMLCAC